MRRALGAKRRDVLRQFLLQETFLSAVGGNRGSRRGSPAGAAGFDPEVLEQLELGSEKQMVAERRRMPLLLLC